jgi:hypothetical protein
MRSNVQKLIDDRYAHQFENSAEIATTLRNRQLNVDKKAANHAVARIGTDYHSGSQPHLGPQLAVEDLLHNDLMTMWAPRVGPTMG